MEVTGIILAGGKSSRMGTEKGLVHLCGKPLISFAISALSKVCNHIIISSSSEAYMTFGYQVVADEFPGIGPLGGIFSTLRQSRTEHNLVLSCDMPFVTHETLAFILQHSVGYEISVPWHRNCQYEPLCAFYHLSVLNRIDDFIQQKKYKLVDLINSSKVNKLIISDKSVFFKEEVFFNVNSATDLTEAERRCSFN